jgi:hypothetical protein
VLRMDMVSENCTASKKECRSWNEHLVMGFGNGLISLCTPSSAASMHVLSDDEIPCLSQNSMERR